MALHPDAYAGLLGIAVVGDGDDSAVARVVVGEDHLNPHRTTHGAFLFSLAGVALAAAANNPRHSGVVSAVHIDYVHPSTAGDALVASAGGGATAARRPVRGPRRADRR